MHKLRACRPDVMKVGYFGSYARGDRGVGSDLDVVLVLSQRSEAPLRRGLAFDTITGFPAPGDLLVYADDEWRRLEAERSPFVRRLRSEVVRVA